jgi:hypothetical protein
MSLAVPCAAGMVLGNTISGISVGLSTVVEELNSGEAC